MVAQLQAGQEVDRYRIEWVLGEGGMASVFRVKHLTLGTTHALKVLSISTKDIRQRLLQEGQMQATLQHPNIVSVSDVLDVAGVPGLLMEYIEGPTLDQWTYRYRPALHEALAIYRGIVAGVGHAHSKGLIHRDIKPGNILLSVSETEITPKVTDFGLAKFAQVSDDLKRTRPGTTMGTPQYMAPEQMRDASKVDHRADLFSLGCILYELICGVPPFQGSDLVELINTVCKGDYVPISHRVKGVPGEVVTTVKGLLQPDPNQRIRSCEEILARLEPKQTWVQLNNAGGLMDHALDGLMDGGADSLSLEGPAAAAITTLIIEGRDRTLPVEEQRGSWSDSLDEIEPVKEKAQESQISQYRLNRSMVWTATMLLALFAAIAGAGLATFGVAAYIVTMQEEEAAVEAAKVDSMLSSPAEVASELQPQEVLLEPVPMVEPAAVTTKPEPTLPIEAAEVVKSAAVVKEVPALVPPKIVPKAVTPAPAVIVSRRVAPEPIPGTNFTYTGASSVVLISKLGQRFAAGEHLTEGSYEVWARFPGTAEVHAGQVIAVADKRIELRCVDVLLQCRAR
jgi:serine/threonine protein kinase